MIKVEGWQDLDGGIMNSSLRRKSKRPGNTNFIASLVSFIGTALCLLACCGDARAQDAVELRPLPGLGVAKKAKGQDTSPDVADKVSPEVTKLIRKVLAGREAEQKDAEAKLRKRGLRVVPELRSWIRQVTGNAEKIEIVLRKILKDVAGGEGDIELATRASSAGLFFEQKLAEAQEHLEYGRYQLARKMAEAILELDRGSPLRFLCRRLIRKARERKLKKELVTRVDAGALVYEVGETPRIVFRVLNKSGNVARFEVRQGIVGELFIVFDKCLFDGSHITNSERLPLRIKSRQEKIVLKPDGGWECEVAYQLPKDLPLRQVVCRARFRVTFRPSRWEIEGDRDSNIPLTSEETEFWVIPPGKKRKLEDPLKRLKLALLLKQNEDTFVAGWLCVWAGKKDSEFNNRFVRVLIDNFGDVDRVRKPLLHELLRQATGMLFKTDAEWARWWKEETEKKSGG